MVQKESHRVEAKALEEEARKAEAARVVEAARAVKVKAEEKAK